MNIVIVGAGPAGLFLANRLLALSPNHTVQIYDSNPNPTDLEYVDSREFGLGLGTKVQQYLNSIEGLQASLATQGIELTPGGLILIPRRHLCALLVQQMTRDHQTCNESSRLSVNFNATVTDVDLARREIVVEKDSGHQTVAYDLLVGADGIGSVIRNTMMLSKPDEIDFKQQQRPHLWKVLQLPMPIELQQSPLRIIRLQKCNTRLGLVFGGCLPRKDGNLTPLHHSVGLLV